MKSLNLTEEAWPYLVAQRGALDDMKATPQAWGQKYADVIFSEYYSIQPFLPKRCDAILDVGGGMGGIDAVLNDHFGGNCQVTILDGLDDPPHVEKHGSTFNDSKIAKNFLHANGVKYVDFIDANDAHRSAPRFFDLVVSIKSWCFHYPPDQYLELVANASIENKTILIIDIRKDKYWDYLPLLTKYFKEPQLIYAGAKFQCVRFRRNAIKA